jgi:A/G-specific adenine glycosylase
MQLLDKRSPALYNQAIMDFGATVCKPMIPACTNCCLSSKCVALKEKKINEYPVKAKRIEKKHRWFYYIIIEHNKTFYIQHRTKKDIWQHLSEFFLIEKENEVDINTILKTQEFISLVDGKYSLIDMSAQYSQVLTHQKINSFFIHITLHKKIPTEPNMYLDKKIISKLAFPKIITQFFNESKMWKAKD